MLNRLPFAFAALAAVHSCSALPEPVTPSREASLARRDGSDFLRGVNLGGWLILEKWMDGSDTADNIFSGVFGGNDVKDQFTFDQLNPALGTVQLQLHWSTYITEQDIKTLADAKFNALRIPIGFWAFTPQAPYISGAQDWLDKAIGWARDNNMKVLVDCHGSPGSQNGQDHSGHAGSVGWKDGDNLQLAIDALVVMAKKYGADEYADVVMGIELTNEPVRDDFDGTKAWTEKAAKAVRDAAPNKKLTIMMHDAWQNADAWQDTVQSLNSNGQGPFAIDTHLYQLYTPADKALSQDAHISKVCGEWAGDLKNSKASGPIYVGEFSADSGCENCSDDQMKAFVAAELLTFETYADGYFFWSVKGPGRWSVLDMLKSGVIPADVSTVKDTQKNACPSSGSKLKR